MPAAPPAFVSEFLNFIEEREHRLQNWGFYDVAFDEADLEHLLETEGSQSLRDAWDRLVQDGQSLGALLTHMRRAELLHLAPDGSGRVRSRFAEGVRLFAHLRQRFDYQDWASGPRLVSDLKLHLAPRRYPVVDVSPAEAWAAMAPNAKMPALQRSVFEALSSRTDGSSYTFAGFQVRSFERIFAAYGSDEHSGTIVSASTGAGKTKAFYIPAFTAIAAELSTKSPPFTKVMAVYPRNVLLADQLREAISEAGKLTNLLETQGKRPITIGALLGDVPPASQFDKPNSPFLKNWKYVRNRGWIVPFLRAPFHQGRGELIWLDTDRRAGRTTLYRADALDGSPEIADGVIQLTRDALQANPPDVLFLSLEMMHRELGNPLWARAFGIGTDQKPRLLLFDEIHNYSGLSGAQAPWIIARWRQAARPNGLHVVGLSATLREAPKHLATVGCVNPERVVECTPTDDELTLEGRDYTILAKGDPASGASLLATSIQAAMLQARLLTPRHVPYPAPTSVAGQSLYLHKVFGFTDQLDSLNRWMPDLGDAEWRRLSQYRLPPSKSGQSVTTATERAMQSDGQIWALPDRLGYDLQQSMRVTRCSSQDPGADAASDIIVATASLEVGYDDPDVGAVIHHKAPRSIASFLQRKGRAGRARGSRPTTLVVLSDWGRDRWLFQNSERLFQPEVEPIKVPLLNPYVQHVQATSFLIDWIGRRVGAPDPVRYLRRPENYNANVQRRAAALLRRLLELGDDYASFHRELGWVLRHTQHFWNASSEDVDHAVDAMLWEAPRPVLRHAVPALLRKLESGWRFADPHRSADQEEKGARQPLPSFIPSASFGELTASDVIIEFPGTDKTSEARGTVSQLIESCPGRVSKRFSVGRIEKGFWLEGSERLLTSASPVLLSPQQLFPESIAIGSAATAAFQPIRMNLVERPQNVKDSSNARWLWISSAEPIGVGRDIPLFAGAEWRPIFREARAFLHGDHNAMRIGRRTNEGRFDILLRGGTEQRGTLILGTSDENQNILREPIGFEQSVDALEFTLDAAHLASRPELDPATLGRLRQEYFKHLLLTSPVLGDAASKFTLEWVWQTSLAMLTAEALAMRSSLEAAQASLEGKRVDALARVLTRMYSISEVTDEDPDDHDAGGRARFRLEVLWRDDVCANEIKRAESILWANLDPAFDEWVRQRHLRSLAEASLAAVYAIAGDVGDGDLIVDVIDDETGPRIIISETAPGGIGQIEAFIQSAIDGSGAFERAVAHALSFCPRSHTAHELLAIVANVRSREGALRPIFAEMRDARGYRQAIAAQESLGSSLEVSGFGASRQDIVSVTGRLLWPGTSRETDAWFDGINRLWSELQRRLGAPIEPRVLAYLMVDTPTLRRRFSAMIQSLTGQVPSEAQLFARAQDFLMIDCHDTCPHCLSNTNRFAPDFDPSRSLSQQWLGQHQSPLPHVTVEAGWVDRVREQMSREDRICIVGTTEDRAEIARALQTLLTEPFERDYLMVWPILSSVSRSGAAWHFEIELRSMGVQ